MNPIVGIAVQLVKTAQAAAELETLAGGTDWPWVKVSFMNPGLTPLLREASRLINENGMFECLFLPVGDSVALACRKRGAAVGPKISERHRWKHLVSGQQNKRHLN